MTLNEYKALMRGAHARTLDELEMSSRQAFQTALAGGFGKDGKPIIKRFEDLFDRKKVEREMERRTGESNGVKPETVEKFKRSKEHAENVLNGISATSFEGEEDINGE